MIDSIDKNKCTGCGTCVEICPMDVFRMDAEKKKTLARYPDDCQTCYNCELECPSGAIRINPFRKKSVQVW